MSDEEPEEAAPAPAARPKKKKRRRAEIEAEADVEQAIDEGEPEPPKGRAREAQIPAFALGFPADPQLDALVAAFEQGDYARVRREAPALVQSTESAAVRKAARELRKRLDPDPIAVYLLAGAALLLTFLAFWYWTHPHDAP
ncbi:MAG: hypothetical protein ABJE95_07870 [Byssovorax sp.]